MRRISSRTIETEAEGLNHDDAKSIQAVSFQSVQFCSLSSGLIGQAGYGH
jgi:hypothetical protein